MRVLEVGSFTRTIKCPVCKSKLEYGISDIYSKTDPDDITEAEHTFICCPICEKEISVVKMTMPPLSSAQQF